MPILINSSIYLRYYGNESESCRDSETFTREIWSGKTRMTVFPCLASQSEAAILTNSVLIGRLAIGALPSTKAGRSLVSPGAK